MPSDASRPRCFVYGQGRCSPGDPRYQHYEKRRRIASYLHDAGADAALPEDVVDVASSDDEIFDAIMRDARAYDFVAAIVPPDSGSGPPGVHRDVTNALRDEYTRPRLFLFIAEGPLDDAWERLVDQTTPRQRVRYSRTLYDECSEIRDSLAQIVDIMRFG
jgi:hypothetical protein